MARIKAKDIAKKLGISTAAVSMALNGKPGVSEETREKVIEAAVKSGYITPRASRSFQHASPVISFVTYVGAGIAAHSSFSGAVLQGVDAAAKELGYRVIIHYLYEDQPLDIQLTTIADDMSGIIFLGTDVTSAQRDVLVASLASSVAVPIVVIDNFLFAPYVDCVGNDNILGAKMAVEHLIACGHRQIGYLRSRQRITNFDDRETGIHLALRKHEAKGLAPLKVIDLDISSELAYQDVCRFLLDKPALASAYFAENDILAASAIRAFTSHGYRVPEDVSIIGFDDVQICEMTKPSITTMHAFKDNLGKVSVRRLHERIVSGVPAQEIAESGTQKIALSLTLKIRESVKTMA